MPNHRQIHRHFKRADPALAEVVKQVGPFTLKPQRDRFKMLVRSIISQQISIAAARSIRERLEARVAPRGIRPETIVGLSIEQFRSVGISRQKASYLHDLADKCGDGTVRLSRLGRMSDDEVIEELIRVKGIGRWSAHMFLIFALGRPDVFPLDDLGVRMAIQHLHKFKELPKRDECLAVGSRWKPYASIGSWYCWRYLDLSRKSGSKKISAPTPVTKGTIKTKKK
ncbi:MAG TPA: DNA-3-methyladenine glycosylase [Pirellulales bacterium]|jgi:DNA-3-methyladenine glycosylase II|nr:DNA-3-methyladenine glycosylase [Pirellulales bacterium]